ncbi:MAG: IclR family transcriptional regulator [Burkholderiales bacterium]|nr:IclR family transcriptional regulator [Burkholderiales bacterium]
MNEQADIKTVAAVERAFSLLEAFGDKDVFLSLGELAQRTGLYKSTILRLAQTLERLGYLARRADGDYYIGPAPLRLGRLFQAGLMLTDALLPVMRKLVEDTGESASFYIRHGDTRLCLYRIDSPQPLRDHFRAGDVLPLDRGSGGVILAAFSRPHPPRYAAVRERLVATSSGALARDMAGVGAPVFDAAHELVGALGVSGPVTRFDARAVERFERIVLEAARSASAALGGDARRFDAALARSSRRAGGARTRLRPRMRPAALAPRRRRSGGRAKTAS